MNAPPVECKALVKRYDDVTAVDGLDLRVEAGECFGLLGPNGAGKTTTVEILLGILAPDAGTVEILGHAWKDSEHAIRERIGCQLQETKLPDKLKVREVVTLFRSFYREGHDVDEVLEQVALTDKASAFVKHLSGGQRQRLAVATALVSRPDLLFLDEPTTGLDPQARLQMWGIIKEFKRQGGTVLLTTHYMEEAERLCDRVGVVDHGRMIALGTPRALIASLGAEHVVEVGLDGDAGVELERLRAVEGVAAASLEDGHVRLTVAAVHDAVPRIIELLSSRGVTLTSLATHHATLEDVFLSLTGRHLREG